MGKKSKNKGSKKSATQSESEKAQKVEPQLIAAAAEQEVPQI